MKIGYTTGVFDMFHVGHLNIIKKAKSECDYLIVGVTSDEETKRVKNKKPIIPFKERIEIISSLKFVDMAVCEDDVDKLKAWDKYKYDVLIKGSDWKDSALYMELEEEFKIRKVEVKFFSYTDHISSTLLRERIKELEEFKYE